MNTPQLRGLGKDVKIIEECTYAHPPERIEPIFDISRAHVVMWLQTPDGFLPFCSCGQSH